MYQKSINSAAEDWGLQCLRYEIKDISIPSTVESAMEILGEAERKKRGMILKSEGDRQSRINLAEGMKSAGILASEAAMRDQIIRAQGEAEAIVARAEAIAKALAMVSESLQQTGGVEAAKLKVIEQYIRTFGDIVKEVKRRMRQTC